MAEPLSLGKRERQIVEALYRLGEASVHEVLAAIPNPPSYSAVRAMLMLLVGKKIVTYREEGIRYLYRAVVPMKQVRRSALRNVVRNFFGGDPADAVAALLDGSAGRLKPEDLERIKEMIKGAQGK
jgi:BlaI family transcriptional regulator, penicillinase repressor